MEKLHGAVFVFSDRLSLRSMTEISHGCRADARSLKCYVMELILFWNHSVMNKQLCPQNVIQRRITLSSIAFRYDVDLESLKSIMLVLEIFVHANIMPWTCFVMERFCHENILSWKSLYGAG